MRNKILVACVKPQDATSYYRAWGNFTDLHKRHGYEFYEFKDALIMEGNQGYLWPKLGQYNYLFMQRLFGEQAINAMHQAQKRGIKVIYELDDNLWEIPESYSIKQYWPKSTLDTIEHLARHADLTIVSTQALADYLNDNFGIYAEVVNNGLNLEENPIIPFNKSKAVVWRGNQTHIEDIRSHRQYFEGQAFHFHFLGHDPVSDRPILNVKDYTFYKGFPIDYYFDELKNLTPQMIYAPLEENIFNLSKSNIAWLEATMAGAVCISNQWGEFKDKGLNFAHINDIDKQEANYLESVELIHEQYDLKKLNDIRHKLISEL